MAVVGDGGRELAGLDGSDAEATATLLREGERGGIGGEAFGAE
eukprot:CAMPEP_0197445816 /NCGR_PEP_ID=MMETSP1175-20131217/10939_1 /TAXON_ID=1003142 /ORGANISM="Triceratium dubium, Strain CCMP147" /LENGTH=42 /DNA_ID= /DNA_START= /DNA_END= /DNA_ORIENTATION=